MAKRAFAPRVNVGEDCADDYAVDPEGDGQKQQKAEWPMVTDRVDRCRSGQGGSGCGNFGET